MVVRKRGRKAHEQRGTHTHGGGHKKKRRGAGNKGGHGNAGRFKHNKLRAILDGFFINKNKGFIPRNSPKRPKTINLFQIEDIADTLVETKLAESKEEKIYINLESIEIDKLLGTGKPKRAFVITAKKFSENAKRKIEEAKGQAILA